MDDEETDNADGVMIPMCHPCFTGDTIAWKVIRSRQARKTHGDTDGKFIITTLTKRHYKPEIFKPKMWVPPMEARPRNIIRLNITAPKKTSTGTYTVNSEIFARILYSPIAFKDIFATLKLRLWHDMPISANNRVISPFCESFIFTKLCTCQVSRK